MFIDIAFNATDKAFQNNLNEIIEDSRKNNVMPIFVGLDYESSLKCLEMAEKYKSCCYLGFHPCHLNSEKANKKINNRENLREVLEDKTKDLNDLGIDDRNTENDHTLLRRNLDEINDRDMNNTDSKEFSFIDKVNGVTDQDKCNRNVNNYNSNSKEFSIIDTANNLTDQSKIDQIIYNGNLNGFPVTDKSNNLADQDEWDKNVDNDISNLKDSHVTDKSNNLTDQDKCDRIINTDFISLIERTLNNLNYNNPRVIGIGECGLDYFRSDEKTLQKQIFVLHLNLNHNLPYFLHCRNSFGDFIEMVRKTNKKIRGVVHSFDGTLEEAQEFLNYGFYIGLNGCSMKTRQNIEVVKKLPLNRILLETDSPYCLIRKSYAGSEYIDPLRVKINTPKNILQIAQVISKLKEIPLEEVERTVYENTLKVFPKLKNFVLEFMNEK